MTEPDEPAGESASPHEPVFDEVRAAAGDVIASLKRLIDATERVVEDPGAFAGAVEGGRSVVEAFLGGFAAETSEEASADAAATAESDPDSRES